MKAEPRRSSRAATVLNAVVTEKRAAAPKQNRGGTGRPRKSDGGKVVNGHPITKKSATKRQARITTGLSTGSAAKFRITGRKASQSNLGEWATPGVSHLGLLRRRTLESIGRVGGKFIELYNLYKLMNNDQRQAFKRLQERDAKHSRGALPSGTCFLAFPFRAY